MEKLAVNRNKIKNLTKEKLLLLTKEELVDRILQLEAHNKQLKNVISKKFDNNPQIVKTAHKPGRSFDFSRCHTRPVLLRLLYFGWNYHGLAVQEDTSETIENHLFAALNKACLIKSRETSEYHRCGRTDKGVSSFGQVHLVISIKLRSKYETSQQATEDSVLNEFPYCKMINRLLPPDIRAVAWLPVPADRIGYSARFDCCQRTYKYYFPKGDLNIGLMQLSCKYLVGSHDFRNLCKMDVANGVTTFVREIVSAEILPLGEDSGDDGYTMFYLKIIGNAFLWHQIRCIMGILLLIGEGQESPEVIKELLNIAQNPRKPQYCLALDLPLNLFHCKYDLLDSHHWAYEATDLGNIISTLQEKWTMEMIKSAMIKDVLNSLMLEYGTLNGSSGDMSSRAVRKQNKCLIQGVRASVYKPLLKRDKCESLEERIDHYKKKQRLKVVDAAMETTT